MADEQTPEQEELARLQAEFAAGVLSELEAEIRAIVQEELSEFNDGFETRLANAFRKALDTVTAELEARLDELEADQARLLRHTGLGGEDV